jgi:hypothetical protein
MKRAKWIVALIVIGFVCGAGAEPRKKSPVALWSGEGNALDSMGGNHGEIFGGVTFVRGVEGKAFQLDGAAYIRVPDAASLRFTNALSVECWFKRDGADSYGTLLDKRDFDTCNYGIIMSSDWNFQVYFNDPRFNNYSGDYEISFSPVPAPDVFHHVVGTFEQIGDYVLIRTYMDGQRVDSAIWQGSLAQTLNTSPLAIGSARDGTGAFFKGVIDEVAIYDYALEPSQVRSHYASLAHRAQNRSPFPAQQQR